MVGCGAAAPPHERGFGGRFGGGGFNRQIDETTLEQIAALTDGGYYAATNAGELPQFFRDLPLSYTTRLEPTEISFGFAAIGALLASIAIGMALLRR